MHHPRTYNHSTRHRDNLNADFICQVAMCTQQSAAVVLVASMQIHGELFFFESRSRNIHYTDKEVMGVQGGVCPFYIQVESLDVFGL